MSHIHVGTELVNSPHTTLMFDGTTKSKASVGKWTDNGLTF